MGSPEVRWVAPDPNEYEPDIFVPGEEWQRYSEFGPFGRWGHEAGLFALKLALNLAEERRDTGWQRAEVDFFHDLGQVESISRDIDPHPVTFYLAMADRYPAVEEAHENFRRLTLALPCSEAERHLLLYDRSFPTDAQALRSTEVEITERGIPRIVRGRELMERWVAWRHQTGEFAGTGSLTIARHAAADIGEQLVLPALLPDDYVAMRGLVRAA